MKKWFFILVFFLVNHSFASIEVILTPNPAVINQEVKLILKQQGSSRTQGIPDISILNQDFQILGTQQSMSYQIINGVSQHENIWTIILLPKQEGDIKIPSLNIGGENTLPQVLSVSKGRALSRLNQDDKKEEPNVFMEWQLEPNTPVLHEQVKLKIKIFHAMPLLDAKLSLPRVSSAILFSLDDSSHEVTIRNDKKYEVETYEYLIYPQKLGKMVVHSPILDALEYDLIPAPVHAFLPDTSIDVSPIPTKNTDVIPAKQFLYEELTPKLNNIEISDGDTFTRRIKLTAVGVPKNLIGGLQSSCGDACKVYTHVIRESNKIVNKELQGSKVFEITYLPEQKGNYEISDIKLSWFNTSERKLDTLIIPGMKILVGHSKSLAFSEEDSRLNLKRVPDYKWQIPTWLSVLLGLGLGIFLMYFSRFFNLSSIISWIKGLEFKDMALKKACLSNNPNRARFALINWAKKTFPEAIISDLHDILNQLNQSEFKDEIQRLIKVLYDKMDPQNTWKGKELWRAFKKMEIPKKRTKLSKKNLNSLNP